jgi:hypothetical protein
MDDVTAAPKVIDDRGWDLSPRFPWSERRRALQPAASDADVDPHDR